MLHVPALPGSPRSAMDFAGIRAFVLRDAASLVDGGVDGMMIENFGDVPFLPARVPPHTVAFLTLLASEVRSRHDLPLGVNVLRNDGLSAMAVAAAANASFVRINVYTGARLADQGILQGEAHRIVRYRRMLAAGVQIWADIAVKHSGPLGQRSLEEEVEDTLQRGLADGVIVSGAATGKETSFDDLRRVKQAAASAPVFVGSGAGESNVARLLDVADGVIVGSALKRGGAAGAPIDPERVRAFVAALRRAHPESRQ